MDKDYDGSKYEMSETPEEVGEDSSSEEDQLVSVGDPFEQGLDVVEGLGFPTDDLRIRAFNAGYKIRTVDQGWIAVKLNI